MDLIQTKTVIDVGCGVGTWLAEFKSAGADVLGVDGEWAKASGLRIPKSSFVAADLVHCALDKKIEGVDTTFSLCISLEVAEHLPPECADGFVSLLTKLSDIVLFSAAIPHQGGTHHVNEQWSTYWVEKFKKHGYVASDVIRALLWGNDNIQAWYRQNMLLFMRESVFATLYRDKIKHLMESCGDEVLSKVHPDFYLMSVEYYHSNEFLRSLKGYVLLSALIGQVYDRSRRGLRRFIKSILKKLSFVE
jgi:SAM-dependent methyltransferase